MCRVRRRLRRSRRSAHDPQNRRQHELVQVGVRVLSLHAGDAVEVYQREGAVGHDAHRALPAVRGWRGIVHGLRRGYGAAHDAGGHRIRLRSGEHRYRRGDGLQYGIHVDYPYNPYKVSWTNSLFENAPADAMGVRARWDQLGWKNKRLWIVGGDGAMNDIGFQSLSRMMASGADIKVLVLDTQVYSNTGGQASTSSFKGQDAKMS